MAKYRLAKAAKNDLIQIHQYGALKFGMTQADTYFLSFFDCFNRIAHQPFAFESVEYVKKGYRRAVCGVHSIYFKITDGTVDIMAIIGRQDLKKKL
jgi:toxin ParE1/3/4